MSRDTFYLVIASTLVVLGAVLAFVVIGSPSHARAIALDEQRVEDLNTIDKIILQRYEAGKRELPATLTDDLQFFDERKDLLLDPGTGRPYTYRRIDDSHFQLCATFALPSSDLDRTGEPDRVAHAAGLVCRDDHLEPTHHRNIFDRLF